MSLYSGEQKLKPLASIYGIELKEVKQFHISSCFYNTFTSPLWKLFLYQ